MDFRQYMAHAKPGTFPTGHIANVAMPSAQKMEDIKAWLDSDEAHGFYLQRFWSTPSPDRQDTSVLKGRTFEFTDPNTAFEFKMRFG